MSVGYTAQRAEAISRLKLLGVSEEIIRAYEENRQIYMAVPPLGEARPLISGAYDELHKFEKEKHFVLYFAIRTAIPFVRDSYLCVGPYEEDWETERAGLKNHAEGVLAYVFSPANPHLSGFNFIWICAAPDGGILQTG